MISSTLPRLLALGSLIALPLNLYAVDRNWTASATTANWIDDFNWSGGVKPTASDKAFVDNGNTARLQGFDSGNANTVYIGDSNDGGLLIQGFAALTTGSGYIGNQSTGSGTATVSGGTWNSPGLYIGSDGTGTLNVSGGTVVGTSSFLGFLSDGTGTATVSDGSFSNSSQLYVGYVGTGTLNLTDSGSVTVNAGSGTVTIASEIGATGTLNIGTGSTAGTLNVAAVTGGDGSSATLNFNHTGELTFSPSLTGSLTVNKTGAGTTTLIGSNTYSGGTTVNNGCLLVESMGSLPNSGTGTTVNSGGETGFVVSTFTDAQIVTIANNVTWSGGSLVFYVASGETSVFAGDLTGGTFASSGALIVVKGGGTLDVSSATLPATPTSVDGSTVLVISVDGTRDGAYGPPLAVQLAPTGFGDNSDPDGLAANGSELNAAYAVIRDGNLHLFLAGNLETNFNKLEIFIDSLSGVGQNTLGGTNPNVDFDGLNAMAGLTFDAGFEADFYLTGSGGNSPVEFFFNFAEVKSGGTGGYIGQTPAGDQTATLNNSIEVGIDNSNTAGVTESDASGAAAVNTGIEFKIPLDEIGGPTGPIKICAFINNTSHNFLSNQVLGSLPADYTNLGAPGSIDFEAQPDGGTQQFFTVVPWLVTNTADSGTGSLRQTIADAPAGTTITFNPGLSGGTITLGGTQLLIDKDLTIDASGLPDAITIDADGNSRIFEINTVSTVILDSLSLINGSVSGSGFPDNSGGAIYNDGTLTLNQATLSGNSAFVDGGGIFNTSSGTLTLNQATLSGNSASFGGGIYNDSGTLTLNQATLSGNSASFGGGIYNNPFSTLTLNQAIVANNTSFSVGPDIRQFGGYGSNTGVNFIGDTSGAATIPGTILTGNPRLAPLGDFGGLTQTMPPLPGSPVIDAGGSTTLTTDQRGAPRSDGSPDIGAVEFQPAIVTTDSDEDDSPEGADLSLREAIAREFVSTVTFDPGVFTGGAANIITLGGSQLTIAKDLTIDASGLPEGITIDANGNSRILEITTGATVTLDSLSLINGSATGTSPNNRGGAIYNQGTLTLHQAILSGNSATFGGGIYNLSTLTLNQSTLPDNSASLGGGILNVGTLTLNQTTLSGNSASSGGGIYNNPFSTLTLIQATLSGNSADFNGGGIYNNEGTLTLNQATLSGNSADEGGGIFNEGTLTLNQAIVANNTASSSGPDIDQSGGFYLFNTSVNFIGDTANSGFPGTAGTDYLTGDPLLAPLGDYGGPTQTMPPLPGSPAIEPAGGETTLGFTTDQRGASRIVGTVVDIGAVEAFPLPVGTFADSEPDGIPDLFEGPDGPYPHLTVGTDDSAVDTDGDGSTDAEELANMTNLYDANDYFRILSFAPAAGFDPANPSFDLSLPTFPGLSYHLESTADLTVDFEDIPDSSFTAEGFSEPITVEISGDAQFIRAIREQ